jgi:hypothetical protein
MTYINWRKPFDIEIGNETFHFPTYGNYGGADYSSGRFGRAPPLDQDCSYLSNRELDDNKDALDYLFYRHDVGSYLADTPAEQQAADVRLIRGINDLSDKQLADPEARLYAGLASIAVGGQALVNNPDRALANKLLPYFDDALDDIADGLAGLRPKELVKAASVLEDTVDTLQEINFPGRAVDRLVDELAGYLDPLL